MRCPKCGQPYQTGALHCAQFRAPLVQTCPQCGHVRPWYVQHCPRCAVAVDDAAVFSTLFREGPQRCLRERYLLRETLSLGAVSARYRADDLSRPGTPCTVLELSTVALFRAEERRQAEAALRSALARWSAVDHPAVPAVVDAFATGEAHYVVTEWAQGIALATLIEQEGLRASPDLARNWGAQLADLLATLHRLDPPLFLPFLAPDRVAVEEDGRLRLVDFGLAHLFALGGDEPYGSVRGYGAPELSAGPPTPQTDIFALGRLLYALLAGRLLERSLGRQLPLRQAVPGIAMSLVKTVARAAHRDPRQRYASAEELRDALWGASAGPLEPIAGWRDLMVPARAPAARRQVRRTPAAAPAPDINAESMEALGFERDPRYGPAAAAAADATFFQGAEAASPASTTDEAASANASADGEARLAVQPRHIRALSMSPGETRRLVLTLRNIGSTEIGGRVTSYVPWVTAPKAAFRLPVGKQARVIITVRAAALPSSQATEPQAISVDTNAGRQWIAATAQVLTTPLLLVEPTVLDWGTFQEEPAETRHLTITNGGGQPLAGAVAARVQWLRVTAGQFRCLPGKSVQVPIQLLADLLPPGEQHVEGALVVDSDGGQERIAARLRRLVPVLDLGGTHIDLGILPPETTERILYIANAGDGILEGSARPLVPWLRLEPQEFHCQPGESATLTLCADLGSLGDGTIEVPQAVRVRSNAGSETLSLRVQVMAPRLAVSGDLAFGEARLGDVLTRTITVANTGSAPLLATIRPLAEWLSATVATVICAPREEHAVEVVADTSRFARGQVVDLAAALRVEAGEMAAVLPASITVLQPRLRVEPAELDFGYVERTQPESRALIVANDGNAALAWNVQTDVAWVEIEPMSGVCPPGHAQSVSITAYGLAADPEANLVRGTLVVNADAGRAKVPLRLAFAAPLLASDTTTLDLGVSVNLQDMASSLRLFNHGLGPLRGRITTDRTWLVVDRASFECGMGRSIEVRVSTDLEELPPGSDHALGTVLVESNGGNLAIDVTLAVELVPIIEAPEALVLERDDPSQPPQGRLTLRNTGLAAARAELRPSAPQLALSRNLLDIKPGKSVRVVVRWQGLPSADAEPPYIEVLSGSSPTRVPVIV